MQWSVGDVIPDCTESDLMLYESDLEGRWTVSMEGEEEVV